MSLAPEKCWCAFFLLERRVYRKRHISLVNFALAFFLSVVITLAFGQPLDAKMTFLFVIFLILAEVFIQVRWRLTLACPFCGFDPVLYIRDRDRAVNQVKIKLEKAKTHLALLSPHNPWTHLGPMINSLKKSRRNKRSGLKREGAPAKSLLSKQI